ncbi:glycosyltransferase family 2 protein [Phocaeicola sp.]
MITVSIVTYKTNLEELSQCLQSLTSPLISRIYIVDNSNQQYISDFCNQYTNVEYISSKNVGYGAGHNQALRQVLKSGEKYHLVLNSDVYFKPSVLDFLAKYMNAHPDVAQIQPNVVYPNGEQQYTCRLLPTPANLIFRRFLPKGIVEKMNIRYQLKFNDHKREMNVPYHQGSFMFFRIECFKKVGLFDERFFMYPEDIDITRRMHKQYRTMFVPDVTIVHAHRAASYKSKKMLKIHIINMIKYFNKWGWIIDKERSAWNRRLLTELGYKNILSR